ncbi:hypothetical protein [Mycobacteroides chelonae]|uniref:hypothetical protein n=1 Tax=Mycobacteroides chelonae TaxID=1774 RepID=UPI0008A9F7BE|nr:hypothetical protein [Mycobacteroides chelonae]OHU29066.1 hypothetical protein BKG78_23650 [Mycobacteroides chelonae]
MSAAYVRIGEVKTETGSVTVHVDPHSGYVAVRLKERGYSADSTVVGPAAGLELTNLMVRAFAIAPSIKAAHEVRMRARATAEDTYDRIVNHAVGGAR